jgi:hypothetical protein
MLRAFLLVIVGLAGDPEHGGLFQKWGQSLVDASARLGVAPEDVVHLTDRVTGGGETPITGRSTRVEIEKAFDRITNQAKPDDVVFVVLIGHGTYDGRSAKFNLPGPDLSAAEFNPLLKRLPVNPIPSPGSRWRAGCLQAGPFSRQVPSPAR